MEYILPTGEAYSLEMKNKLVKNGKGSFLKDDLTLYEGEWA